MKYHGCPLLRVSRITIIMLAAIVGASACTDRPVRTVETTSTTVPPAPPTVLDPEPTTTSTTTTVPREGIPRLMVHEEGRYLALEDGTPFLPLGDTAWNIFQQLTRPEMEMYLDSLVEYGYNMVAISFLGEAVVGYQPNPDNEDPFVGTFFESDLNEDYWDDVDFFMEEAEARGLYVYAVMAWFKEYLGSSGTSNLNPSTAERYGEQIGARYGSRSNYVIFVTGGDQNPTELRNDVDPEPTADAMMGGVAIGINGTEDYTGWIGTYHTARAVTAGEVFQDRDWFHIGNSQSGQCTIFDGWAHMEIDWDLTPVKPAWETELNYESSFNCSAAVDAGHGERQEPPYVIQGAYQAVFAGSLGFINGHGSITHQCIAEEDPLPRCLGPWQDFLDAPARVQAQHLKALILSRGSQDGEDWTPHWEREPDQSLITSGEGSRIDRKGAMRSAGRWLLVGFPQSSSNPSATIDLSVLDGPEVEAWWFNAQDGKTYDPSNREITEPFESVPASGTREYTPPSGPPDNWVLVLDSSNTDFPAPGKAQEPKG